MGYIVRMDKPKDTPRGTHGWQVRGSGKRNYHSKLFSDGQYGGPEKALIAAKTYLQSYAETQPAQRIPANKPYHQGRILSNNTSGITGVYYTEYAHRWDKERLVGYWGAFIPKGPEGQRGWHKKFNIERFGYDEARRLAIEFRQEWEQAVKTGDEKALADFFEEYHYSRLIEAGFGSEEWAAFGEGLLEIQANL